MDITGLNKAKVLAALYNASRPQGFGFLNYKPNPMTEEQARKILDDGQTYFDYLNGRIMKIDLEQSEVNTWAYNRDNGPDAAENVVETLRRIDDINSDDIQKAHQDGKTSAIEDAEKHLKTFEDVLGPAIEKAKQP